MLRRVLVPLGAAVPIAFAGAALAFPIDKTARCVDRGLIEQALAKTGPSPQVIRSEVLREAVAKIGLFGCPAGGRSEVVLVDYTIHSALPRLWIVNLKTGAGIDQPLHVAHGKGSDPEDKGIPSQFSNVDGSLMSSLGLFRGAYRYNGRNGVSLKLKGLEPTNSLAYQRYIVVHTTGRIKPDYVSPQWLSENGKLGLSEGCFVVMRSDYRRVEQVLANGGLLYASATPRTAPPADAASAPAEPGPAASPAPAVAPAPAPAREPALNP